MSTYSNFSSSSIYEIVSTPILEISSPSFRSQWTEVPAPFLEEGCWYEGNRNCTTVCRNPELLWGSGPDVNLNVVATVWNCLSYMTAIAMAKSGNVTFSDQLPHGYGLVDLDRVNVSSINSSVGNCISSYCAATKKCSQDEYTSPFYTIKTNGLVGI